MLTQPTHLGCKLKEHDNKVALIVRCLRMVLRQTYGHGCSFIVGNVRRVCLHEPNVKQHGKRNEGSNQVEGVVCIV